MYPNCWCVYARETHSDLHQFLEYLQYTTTAAHIILSADTCTHVVIILFTYIILDCTPKLMHIYMLHVSEMYTYMYNSTQLMCEILHSNYCTERGRKSQLQVMCNLKCHTLSCPTWCGLENSTTTVSHVLR